ncbi:CDK5 and ABL1 enzyme substrate 2-like isoform X2 [Takifugu flavidus]|nr:CDK5 and ABL1 enzyme substrate 2-like isoform X2 [Takifugu flavidus]
MATALCGLPVTGRNNQPAKTQREHRRKTKDSRRRQAALLFLNNISLDGRPRNQPRDEHADQNADDEPGLSDSAGGPAAEPLPPAESHGPVAQVTEPAGSCSISSIPGVFTPTRPSSVTSPGFAGANEVFLEGGCAAEVLAPDTFTSPAPGVHQPCARVRSTPAAVSPVQAGTNLETRQRLRNVSGSPGPKVPKKVHFIKSMRQYDTRGCRIVLVCAKRSLYAAFSVLPYGESAHLSDTKLEAQRQRLPSVVAADLLPSLEGVELGSSGKVNVQSPAAEDQKRVRRAAPASVLSLFQTVSYAQFLYPTNALARMKSAGAAEAGAAQTPQSRFRASGQRNPASAHPTNAAAQEPCVEEVTEYDPNLLSDPQWPCGRHKRVLIFASYMTTVIEYVKPSDLKKDMNVTFKERFPHIKLTLSKIRSLKREMRAVSEEFGLQPVTTAMAFVYFEKLVLQGRLNKQNRKLVAAACVLLAAKISSDLRKPEVKQLIDKLEERFRINRRELIPLEFPVLVALEMGLYFPESKVMPHYRRLVQQG